MTSQIMKDFPPSGDARHAWTIWLGKRVSVARMPRKELSSADCREGRSTAQPTF